MFKNKRGLLFIFYILFVFFIFPKNIDALSYKSNMVSLKESVLFYTDEFKINLEYTNGTADNPSALTGYGVRTIDDMYYYHYIVYYYDNDFNEIGAADGYNGFWTISNSNPSIYNGNYISSNLNIKNMYTGYTLNDIEYYRLFIEPTTKGRADDYLYNGNKKVNPNGIDPITDTDTILMSSTISLDDEYIEVDGKDNNTINYNPNNNYSYTINSYDINMIVNENNTLDITEKIGAFFNTDKHGIYRKLPLKNKVERLDGTTSYNRVKITNISVNEEYDVYNEDGYKVIQIGSPNYTITGAKDYEIKYLYNLGKDTGKEYDELYFNLIGDEWDTVISNITFTITMPKEFAESKLGFSNGVVGSTTNDVAYTVNGNVITGKLNGHLNPGEALTIRLELPEGYFVGASSNIDYSMFIFTLIPIIFVIIVFLMWLKYGKDNKVIETVEFYPPEGFNSLEVGFLYKGKADSNDVISLLIYLANKGYIRIEETESSNILSSHSYRITKLKEYDGNNVHEKVFLKGLFSCRGKATMSFNELIQYMKNPTSVENNEDIREEVDSVTQEDLYDNFYITINSILREVNSSEQKEKIFEKKSLKKGFLIVLMIIITFILITYKPINEYGEVGSMLFALLFPGIGFSFLFAAVLGLLSGDVYVNGKKTNSSLVTIIFGVIWGSMFGGIPWLFIVLPILLVDPIYLISYIVGLICVFFLLLLYKHMPKRTMYGNAMLGKVLGFKNFLENVEKQELERRVLENPAYFYDILPYTYVLGISDKWIDKFETMALQAPNWYSGRSTFSTRSFSKFMYSTMNSASYVRSSSSSGGGGSSGGGSSGGGSGGGGGGSW